MMTSRRPRKRRRSLLWVLTGLAIVAASFVTVQVVSTRDGGQRGATASVGSVDPTSVYDPVAGGEELPDGYRRGLARDAIEPVYEPTFTSPDFVDWPADTLVIGVAAGKVAKAYPVTHLNQHEMVIDSLEGIPILVTW